MKRIALALLATAAFAAAHTARADTRVSLGVNIGAPVYTAPGRVIVRERAPVVYAPAPSVVYAPPAPRGYWQDVTVKTWIPERVSWGRNRWGRPMRMVEPGHFEYRTNRVWVEASHHHDRDYGRGYNPGYGYGWNR